MPDLLDPKPLSFDLPLRQLFTRIFSLPVLHHQRSQAIRDFARAFRDTTGNLPPMYDFEAGSMTSNIGNPPEEWRNHGMTIPVTASPRALHNARLIALRPRASDQSQFIRKR